MAPVTESTYFYGTGRRKCAIARVRLFSGEGSFVINGKSPSEYFGRRDLEIVIMQPLRVAGLLGKCSGTIKVDGGGMSGQAGAVSHGIARALIAWQVTLRTPLKRAGLLTRDSRVKERKKYGLKRARKAPQYTKR